VPPVRRANEVVIFPPFAPQLGTGVGMHFGVHRVVVLVGKIALGCAAAIARPFMM